MTQANIFPLENDKYLCGLLWIQNFLVGRLYCTVFTGFESTDKNFVLEKLLQLMLNNDNHALR